MIVLLLVLTSGPPPNSRPEVDRNEKATQVFVAFAANSRSGAFRFCSAIR